jgi:heavy metal translocating P-type ATPase
VKKIIGFIRQYWEFNLALIVLLAGIGLQIAGLKTAVHSLLGVTSVLATLPMFRSIWHDIRSGTYGVDILAVTAILVAVAMHEYWTAIIVVLMLTGGEALEDYAEHRAKRELDALLDHAPQTARVVKKHGKTIEVPVAKVLVKDKLEIRPGEVVPVDGVLLEGEASFDESSLTGESLPQIKTAGDSVLSGSIATDGLVVMQATATAEHSQYQEIIKLVQSASASQSPFVRLADRYSVPFTIVAFGIAFGAWGISGDSMRFLQVMVVATPCPLILAAPIAIISGMSRAAKHGIIIRTGSALETLAAAKTIALDKTGTLTQGNLRVSNVETFNGFSETDILQLAASVEANSNHVLASAMVSAATEKKIKTQKVKNLKETAGHGMQATVSGKKVTIGRQSFLESQNISLHTTRKHTTATYIAVDGIHAGTLLFADTIRDEAKDTLTRLRKLGVRDIHMITGDNQQAANTIAKQLGITHVTAEALPRDKLLAVEQIKNGPVAFVGDGVNDAPVLTASDVGIALGARGATAASESADIVIMLDDLGRVATAKEVSQHTIKIAKQSILVGIGLSVILMLIFATGRFAPIYGALLQEVVDVVVILNALRAHGTFKRSYVQV